MQRELTSLRVALASFDHDRMLAFFDMPEKKGFVSLPHVLEVRRGCNAFPALSFCSALSRRGFNFECSTLNDG